MSSENKSAAFIEKMINVNKLIDLNLMDTDNFYNQ